MKILGIDTTTKFLCLGIYDGANIYEYNLEVGTRLSSLLSITIKKVLDVLGWRISDIDYFACGLGPGSFTGMRVGLATMKGISWAAKKPLIGISTLDILAQDVKDTKRLIVPIIDAKRNLIYCSVYKNKNGKLYRIKPYLLLSEREFFKNARNNTVIFGDAVGLYRDKILMQANDANILDKDYWYPKAHNIIKLALEKIRDKKFSNSFALKPIYLYPKECQIRISHMANRISS